MTDRPFDGDPRTPCECDTPDFTDSEHEANACYACGGAIDLGIEAFDDYADQSWGVWCIRSGGSRMGPAEAWAKSHGTPIVGTESDMRALADEYNAATTSQNVSYSPRPWRD